MYHCAAFNDVQRIPEELRTECDFGRQTGEDNSQVLEDFLNNYVFRDATAVCSVGMRLFLQQLSDSSQR